MPPPSLPPHVTNKPNEPVFTTEKTITISFSYLILSMIALYVVPLTICLIIIIRFHRRPTNNQQSSNYWSNWSGNQSSWYSGFMSYPFKKSTNISMFKSMHPSKQKPKTVLASFSPTLYKPSRGVKQFRRFRPKYSGYKSATRNNYVKKRSLSPKRITLDHPRSS